MKSFHMVLQPEHKEIVTCRICPYTFKNSGSIMQCMCHNRHFCISPLQIFTIKPDQLCTFGLHKWQVYVWLIKVFNSEVFLRLEISFPLFSLCSLSFY